MITCFCPNCRAEFQFSDELEGRKIRCEACHTAFAAPPAGSENVHAVIWPENLQPESARPIASRPPPAANPQARPSPTRAKAKVKPSGANGFRAVALGTLVLGIGAVGVFYLWNPGSSKAAPETMPVIAKEPTVAPDTTKPVSLESVLSELDKARGNFTPEVRRIFLAFRKSQAVAELGKHKITLPPDLLEWVDADPVMASTIYGIRHGSPAQALYVLRSLDLDLGRDRLQKYTQFVLAATVMYANTVTLAAPESNSFSLKSRQHFTVKIPPSPLVEIDTRAKDRPLDMNDHIINFLETEEVGGIVKPRDPILTAGKVVASLKLQKEFNDYMVKRVPNFKPIDCGDNVINTYQGVIWRNPYCARLQAASELFTKAYIAKGRLPEKNDPPSSPTEWIAYQIDNAENPKRKTDLSNAWPIHMYVAGSRIPLREAEFVWDEKAKGINPMRYIMYIGSIAQSNTYLITLSRLQPFAFTYNSYPGKRLWGGVCGSHTHTAMVAGHTMGMPMVNCSSPGHSFPGSVNRDKNSLYSLSAGNTGAAFYFGIDKPEVAGSDINKIHATCWGINYGLEKFLDANLAWTLELSLPPELRTRHGSALLASALDINPYHIAIARTTQATLPTAFAQYTFFQHLKNALPKDKPGCPVPQYLNAFETNLYSKLEQLPLPTNKTELAAIAEFVSHRSDALWAKYEVAHLGLPQSKERQAKALQTSVSGTRTPQTVGLLAQRLAAMGNTITDTAAKQQWAETLLTTLRSREFYAPDPKKPLELAADPCFTAAYGIHADALGISAAQAAIETELTAAIQGGRTWSNSKLLAQKIIATGNRLAPTAAKKQTPPRTAWCKKLLDTLRGHEVFADRTRNNAQVSDPCLDAIYSLDNSRNAERDRLVKDYQAAVAANRGDEVATALSMRMQAVRASITDNNERNTFDNAIFTALGGHEFYYPDMNRTSVMKVDPVMRILQHKATKEMLFSGLRKVLENGQSPESGTALAEYLRFLWMPVRWDVPKQQALAQELIAALRGHELYAPNPQKPDDLRFETLLSTIYHNWGRTPHGQGGIYTAAADQKACENWLKKIIVGKRTPETCTAMKTYLECLVGRINGNPPRKAWGDQLLLLVRGKEYFEIVGPNGARVWQPDPAAAYIYAIAGQKLPPQPKK